MENKIEIGEYVRFSNGKIIKCTNIYSNKIISNHSTYKNKSVINHNKNIFYLLESEDTVVLEYYVSKYAKRIKRKFEVYKIGNHLVFKNVHCTFTYDLVENNFIDGKGFNVKLKSILTKEEFESRKFEV